MARERCALCGLSKDEFAKLKNITFRGVPRNQYIRSQWQEFCNKVYKLPRSTIRLNSTRVCSLHFTDDCFYTRNGYVHTKPFAIPTLYVEPVICRNKLKKEKKIKRIPSASSDIREKPLINLQSTSMDPIIFPPQFVKCQKCLKNKECHKHDKITTLHKKGFDHTENDGVNYANDRFQLCECVLPVLDNHAEQSYAYNGENKIYNNIDERNRELARLIKEKSESLIHFIESVTKSSTSFYSNENCESNNIAVIDDNKPQQREIPLHRVVDYMKRARANKKHKRNLELSNQIKEKSQSLTDYIESTIGPSTSYQLIESEKASYERNINSLKYENDYIDVASSDNYRKKNICIVTPIKSDEDY